MYGIVNKAVKDLIVSSFGQEKWQSIKEKSGVNIDFFISGESYDDEVTIKLAMAVSEEMEMPIDEVLFAFGEWWVLKTTREKYSGLMQSGGSNLKEFILNLPIFHNRIMLIYPKLTPPEFRVTDITENSVNLHYISKRVGFNAFVKGLLSGLSKMFNTNIDVQTIQSREESHSHEIYKIIWL